MSKQVLIIDDDSALTELLSEYLGAQDYQVTVCHDGQSGLSEALARDDIDVILLDVMMPQLDGFEVLKRLRNNRTTPVIMLTARGDDYDRILGLELGADDYLPKPFNHRELSARVKALIRRSGQVHMNRTHSARIIDISGVCLNQNQQSVSIEQQNIALTSTEFTLLRLLMLHAGELVSKNTISEQVLGRRLAAFDRSIDMHVSNLRKKLLSHKKCDLIKTVRGSGYIFRQLER